MTKEAHIQKTLRILKILPVNRVKQITDFAEEIMKKHEQQIILEVIEQNGAFGFLTDEEDLYSIKDIKKRYKN